MYVDPSTIRQNGNVSQIWVLGDFKKAKSFWGGLALSTRMLMEIDCKVEKIRTSSFIAYSENMGRGTVIYSDDEEQEAWTPITPSSVGRELHSRLCKK
jgi:hypothetical protein